MFLQIEKDKCFDVNAISMLSAIQPIGMYIIKVQAIGIYIIKVHLLLHGLQYELEMTFL